MPAPPWTSAPASGAFGRLAAALTARVIGQSHLVERLLIALLADGHLLVEGAPGLAKTRSIRTLAALIDGSFQRIQFTPDLLPSDITGTEIYRPESGEFEFRPGPLFHELVLADEINRAPAKVQSALLEAMGERQVSAGAATRPLPELFMVMATQNPLEQEGTYPLPEAQLDRFLLHVVVDYPDAATENAILELARDEVTRGRSEPIEPLVSAWEIFAAREAVMTTHVAPSVQDYLVQLVLATREPAFHDPALAPDIEYGVSPRATIALDRAARARAWLDERDYVTPGDIQAIAPDVFRHRLVLTLAAQARGRTADDVIEHLLDVVPLV